MDYQEFLHRTSLIVSARDYKNRDKHSNERRKAQFNQADFEKVKANVDDLKIIPFVIIRENEFEILIQQSKMDDRHLHTFNMECANEKHHFGNGDDFYFQIQNPSDEMAYYIIRRMDTNLDFRRLRSLRLVVQKIDEDVDSLLHLSFRGIKSLVVHHDGSIKPNDVRAYAYSVIYYLAYTYNEAYTTVDNIDEIFTPPIPWQRPRPRVETLDASRKIYDKKLIEQYQLAMLSEDIIVKFLGFYHIAEYFYEKVFTEVLISDIQESVIKSPPTQIDEKQLMAIINKVNDRYNNKKRGAEFVSLKLTLGAYIKGPDHIKNKLINHTENFSKVGKEIFEYIHGAKNLLEYYEITEVSFVKLSENSKDNLPKTTKIDFNKQLDKLIHDLATRIYSTRNAVVHYKYRGADMSSYNPFENQPDLKREIPLMQYVAEEIIENSAIDL